MRLLHAETKQFREFWDHIPPYAILSHTWGPYEQSVKDVEQYGYTPSLKTDGCCKQALDDGLEYVWIDTFCIDQRSSAELSEAINSMWAWYGRAKVCYAYLSDVRPGTPISAIYEDDSAFCKSRWFTRAWTLQELLVPRRVAFYNKSWDYIGETPFNVDFTGLLARVTRIPLDALLGNFQKYSIAQKMSWASHRTAKMPEDTAYSLLGLFGIHMPLLYGEGKQAFKRLQEEIIKVSDDESIFAWGFQRPPGQDASLFAASPLDFENCGLVIASAPAVGSDPYILTNKGLRIKTSTCKLLLGWGVVTLARLNCSGRNWAEERKSLALVMESRSRYSHDILTRRCDAAPLLVPSKLFSESRSTELYVHRSMGHWLTETRSGLQIQCWLFGEKVTCNIREFYPPSWRTILTSKYVMWGGEREGQTHQSIAFLVEDANRPNYMVSIEYSFSHNFGILVPHEVEFSAAFVERGITLAEAITVEKVRPRRRDKSLDLGDSELRMHLDKGRALEAQTWIMHIDIVDKNPNRRY